MDDDRFREARRSLGFAQDRSVRPHPSDPVVQRATPPILDRFRAMLREREEELRADGGDETPPPPDGHEIVRMYEELLSELTFNSKPIITELTIIAGEQREHAKGIADAVCARIDEVLHDQKLPALYLLDSIVKNIGREYVKYFSARLPKVFCEAYNEVHSVLHPAMRHLFGTWSQVFPPAVLSKIDDVLKFSTPEIQKPASLTNIRNSETPPRPSHGIHVNPKYLEAQQQVENPATYLRDVSSGIHASGQRSSSKYIDHDLDHLDFRAPHLMLVREDSPQTVTLHGSSMVRQEGTFLSSQRNVMRPLSPTRIGIRRSVSPRGQGFQRSPPALLIEKSSPSRAGLEFGSHRASERDGWFGRSCTVDDGIQQPAALTTYNGYGRQRQRELIDAYGNYRGKGAVHEKFPKIPRVDINGSTGELAIKDWQNSIEEEYVWEDMSPTLADQSKRKSMLSEPSSGNLATRANSSRPGIMFQKSDFRRRSWPVPPLKDSVTAIDDSIAVQHYGLGSMNKAYLDDMGGANEHLRHFQNSRHAHEHGSLAHALLNSSQDDVSPKSQGIPSQLPYLVSAVTPSVTQKRHTLHDNPHNAEASFMRLSSAYPDSLNVESSMLTSQKAHLPRVAPLVWPPAHTSQPLLLFPTSRNQQVKRPFDYIDTNKPVGNLQRNFSVPLPQQQFDTNERKLLSKGFQVPYQLSGSAQLNSQNPEQNSLIRIQSQETHGSFTPPVLAQNPANLVAQPLSGAQLHGQSVVLGSILSNSVHGTATSAVQRRFPDVSFHRFGAVPPLPPGPPPSSSRPLPTSQVSGPGTSHAPTSAFSGLISSLMAQGLISLTPPAVTQNSMGLEFNAELLKIRHEPAINSMYSDLPRQCTTCGLRFKCQEDHSNHMDWHVTKNRISKNRKQKPSRKWFVSGKEWLCGAETLGTDVIPGFLPTGTTPENKEDTEMAVPADENQTVCALCGEPFEDFYSDETEEWMYRGAVYMNAPNGNIGGLDRSQLGPIVHAKCRTGSTESSGQA